MNRSDWAKAVDPFVPAAIPADGSGYQWNGGVLKVSRGRPLSHGIEINVRRLILTAGHRILGEHSVHRDLRKQISSGLEMNFGLRMPEIEACYFQESGYFAIIPKMPFPITPEELRRLIELGLEANDWLAAQVKGLKPAQTEAPPRQIRPLSRPLRDSDFGVVIQLLRLSAELPPAAAGLLRRRVCGIADLVQPCGISDAARDTQEARIREHVVPCAVLVDLLEQRINRGADDQESAMLLRKHLVVVTVTETEARRMNSVLASKDSMPDSGWSLEEGDTYARLRHAGITWSDGL